MKFSEIVWVRSRKEMENWPEGKFLVGAVNYRAFAISRGDIMLSSSLLEADALLPDGDDIVKACKWLKLPDAPEEKIDGADVVSFELDRLAGKGGGTVFFLGCTPEAADLVRKDIEARNPGFRVVSYSPTFKPFFTKSEDRAIIEAIHAENPDLLLVDMGSPKQEKWLYYQWKELDIRCHAVTVTSYSAPFQFQADNAAGKFKGVRGFFTRLDQFFYDKILYRCAFFFALLKEKFL